MSAAVWMDGFFYILVPAINTLAKVNAGSFSEYSGKINHTQGGRIMELTPKQITQLGEKNIPVSELHRQIGRFRTGMKYVELDRPARVGDGILEFDKDARERYSRLFREEAKNFSVVKFIPASGAATRMFKDLFGFLNDPSPENISFDELSPTVRSFAENLHRMPFFGELQEKVSTRYPGLTFRKDPVILKKFLEVLLHDEGMQYGSLPKALLTFHLYGDRSRMPFEEHIVEWVSLLSGDNRPVHLHFTLSGQHVGLFEVEVEKKLPGYRKRFNREILVTWSVQDPSTDTIAAGEDNTPLTDESGLLLFRPGGHGALLYNLNRIDADIIFLKNIDNMAVEEVETENLTWKSILGGVIIETIQRTHAILTELDLGTPSKGRMQEILSYISATFKKEFDDTGNLRKNIHQYLDRPLRVCGMVENTGEPGGGPFWVRHGRECSLQIIESAQIDFSDPDQKAIASRATHFNPVDVVCAVKDYKGKKFDLDRFSDPDTSFISVKSHQGKVLKALEHPGLWNGAMGHWLTLFVEVPLLTFNPVKTINDLLRPEHQHPYKPF